MFRPLKPNHSTNCTVSAHRLIPFTAPSQLTHHLLYGTPTTGARSNRKIKCFINTAGVVLGTLLFEHPLYITRA